MKKSLPLKYSILSSESEYYGIWCIGGKAIENRTDWVCNGNMLCENEKKCSACCFYRILAEFKDVGFVKYG